MGPYILESENKNVVTRLLLYDFIIPLLQVFKYFSKSTLRQTDLDRLRINKASRKILLCFVL